VRPSRSVWPTPAFPDEELDAALADLVAPIVAVSWFSHREHQRTLLRTDGFSLTDGTGLTRAYRIGRRVGPDFDARVRRSLRSGPRL